MARMLLSGRTWVRRSFVLGVALGLMTLAGGDSVTASHPPGGTATYTTDADFNEGTLLNVNHDAPNNNQLQLNETAEPFPFVNIAASARGTAIRINVNDGAILGEYLTAPDGRGRDPSRTTVDNFGNVWVANRAEFDGGNGSVARVGLILGGTRADADGTPNPAGQYLKPPFDYSTCVDRDGDALIKTSSGLANILPWTNTGGADDNGGVTTAEDECIINYTRVTGTGTRTVAIDANNDVWVGGLGDQDHEKLNGVTGQPVPDTQFNMGCGGYGGLMDGSGTLWSAQGGSGLLRFVPDAAPPPAGTGTCFPNDRGDYGLGIDPNTGHIWHSSLFSSGVDGPCCRLYELDPAGTVVNSYEQPFGAQGVAVDGNSHVWMAEIFGDEIWHLAPDPANPGQHVPVGTVSGLNGVTGVAVDANGKVWAAEIGDSASRIDPSAGPVGGGGYSVGAIDLTVSLGAGAGPYNYSDMTGFVAIGTTSPQGTWTLVRDGGTAAQEWGKITWNTEPQGSVPAGTSITVEARAADTQPALSSQPFAPVSNGVLFTLVGRFLEVRATLQANLAGDSPVLSDITIATAPRQPKCGKLSVSVGPPGSLTVRVQDLESGLKEVIISDEQNATVTVPPFSQGTTAPVDVIAEKPNPSQQGRFRILVRDMAGNINRCTSVGVIVF